MVVFGYSASFYCFSVELDTLLLTFCYFLHYFTKVLSAVFYFRLLHETVAPCTFSQHFALIGSVLSLKRLVCWQADELIFN